jgi:translation initiation factor 5B
MHGLEQTTLESIQMLKAKKIPFVVALNKIDRLYEWKAVPFTPFQDAYNRQEKSVRMEFEDRLKTTKIAFSEQGLNAELYTRNEDERKYIHLVPTSAITGEGIPDLLLMLIKISQRFMRSKFILDKNHVEATVLELKITEGHGITIDVILRNGQLKVNDRIVLCALGGAVDTRIKTLLLPSPLTEMRVKNTYSKPKSVMAAVGVKIAAQDLEQVVPGSSVIVVHPSDNIEELKEEAMRDLKNLLDHPLKETGVCVQSSTLGSLEALLVFLAEQKIPVSGINVGPIHLKDVKKAMAQLEHDPMYACILGFDVKVDKDAQLLADREGVTIFTAPIIYHLETMFMDHILKIRSKRKEVAAHTAVFPCVLRIKKDCVFNKKDPIVVGVEVLEGFLSFLFFFFLLRGGQGKTTLFFSIPHLILRHSSK